MIDKLFQFLKSSQSRAEDDLTRLSPKAEKLVMFLVQQCKDEEIENPEQNRELMEQLRKTAKAVEKDLASGKEIKGKVPYDSPDGQTHIDINFCIESKYL